MVKSVHRKRSRDFILLKKLWRVILGKARDESQCNRCTVCGCKGVAFLPLPDVYRANALRHGFVHFGKGEMTAHDTYTCGHCGASDRERMYMLWIGQQIEKGFFNNCTRTIHFAPEAALSKRLRALRVFNYETADLLMNDVDHRVDMTSMPFEDESFDFFVCSHVLEHVENDDQAIKELYRITKHGGSGILVAPIVVGLDRTVEDPNVIDAVGRWRLFGQDDHVRLYAHADYVSKIRRHGFRIEELGMAYFGAEIFRSLGLKPTSILYVVHKSDLVRSCDTYSV